MKVNGSPGLTAALRWASLARLADAGIDARGTFDLTLLARADEVIQR